MFLQQQLNKWPYIVMFIININFKCFKLAKIKDQLKNIRI